MGTITHQEWWALQCSEQKSIQMRAGTASKSIGVRLWGERRLKKTVKKFLEPKSANKELWLPEMDPP